MTTPEAKEKHYWEQVQAALIAGEWNSNEPATTPRGGFIPWPELFRKAKKHGKQPDVIEVASQTHYLSLLLETTRKLSRTTGENERSERNIFLLGDECLLPEERRDDAQRAFESLQQLNSSNDYAKQITAYFAYALGRPSECLDAVAQVSLATGLKASHPTLVITSEDQKTDASSRSASITPTEIRDSDAWILLEAIRTTCLEGMCHERISPGSPSQALTAYDKGISLLRSYTVAKSQTRLNRNYETFRRYRELWAWTERTLWRSISLSCQNRSIERTLDAFRAYALHSCHWPPSFQPQRRSTICSLYLRALVILGPHTKAFNSNFEWVGEIREIVHENRSILDATTKFPSAGERNVPVEEFVDLCVAVWEAGGALGDQASWVIDVLWWATRLTFNSPRILRHMFRLLHVSGDHDLAKRVLRLYVQIVRKARETGTVDTEGHDTHDSSATDTDALWVYTLVQGARMLCRVPKDIKEVQEAGKLVELARAKYAHLDDEMMARVELADGIYQSVLALYENDVATRSSLLSSAIIVLTRSVDRHPTPSSLYHLALCLSRAIPERNLERAVELCRRAVEAEPNEIRHWHLLALLLAKQGEWKKAKGVIDAAAEIANDVEKRLQSDDLSVNGVFSRDFADSGETNSNSRTAENGDADLNPTESSLIDRETRTIPLASTLLKPMQDRPAASHRDLFEHTFQLRMTDIIITELTEGPDSVEICWLEVFEWYSQRRDIDATTVSQRPSVETRRSPSPLMRDQSVEGASQPRNSIVSSGTSTSTNGQLAPEDQVDAATIRYSSRPSYEANQRASLSNDTPASTSHRAVDQAQSSDGARHSSETQRSDGRGKRVQQMLKNQVHKQQARITTISRKIGHGVTRSSVSLHRSVSTPDLQAILARTGPYQASSIHSRRRLSFSSRVARSHRVRDSSLPPPVPSLPPMSSLPGQNTSGRNIRSARERRLLSDLWLMSAATFRRLEKLDQARGAIQEAEELDEENEAVWVQLGLYFHAQGDDDKAVEALNKALFISQDYIPATIHLSKLYLTSISPRLRSNEYGAVHLAVGMLEALTHGVGWDVAEAWYLLAKGYGMQGRKERQRECLVFALSLTEVRGVRDTRDAVGLCL